MLSIRGSGRGRVVVAVTVAAVVLGACGDEGPEGGDCDVDAEGTEASCGVDEEAVGAAEEGDGGGGNGGGTGVTAPTIDELLARDEPLNIAHAGGDAAWPHSTLYAFGEAVEAGVDMLEMDVRLSADEVVMVHHDGTVDRITEAEGPVDGYTAAELQEFDAAHWFEPGEPDGREAEGATYPLRGVRTGETEPPDGYGPDDFTIPTFAEVATAFPDLPLDIEIKGEGDEGAAAAEALAAELEELDRLDSVVVTSFDQPTVDVFRDAAPTVEVSPGVDDLLAWYSGEGDLDGYRVLQLPPEFGDVEVVTGENLDRLADEAPEVRVWLWMNSFDEDTGDNYQRYLDLGVDGIITARPGEFPR